MLQAENDNNHMDMNGYNKKEESAEPVPLRALRGAMVNFCKIEIRMVYTIVRPVTKVIIQEKNAKKQ